MARGMEAQNHFGPSIMFDADALWANGTTAIGADFNVGANAPNVRPPSTSRAGRRTDRFTFWARSQACCGVMCNSR